MIYKELLDKLMDYDLISFDIFDTLITRKVLLPIDIFKLVEIKIDNINKFSSNFSLKRIEAENKAINKYGDKYTLDDIYSFLDSDLQVAKDIELETELEMIIPKRDMLDLFNTLKSNNKKIILVSDMYLSSSFVKKLLEKSGYKDFDDLIISNEYNASKANGKLWNIVYDKYNSLKSIHIGDSKHSDYDNVTKLNKDALLIDSSYDLFNKSGISKYLIKYHNNNPRNLILLGLFVNEVCFNSPFEKETNKSSLTNGIWFGPTFSTFMNFLYKNKDDSVLLFVTREGFLLQDYYKIYCDTLGVKPQDNTLFYTSRQATTAASSIDLESLDDVINIAYTGTLSRLLECRFNYKLKVLDQDEQIELPKDKNKVLSLIKDNLNDIFNNSLIQNDAYNKYFKEISHKFNKNDFTVVDIGYGGTAQYFLSKIYKKNISGKYMFLNPYLITDKIGCKTSSIAITTKDIHPIYDNLFFLEAIMQVPYGQLKEVTLNDNGDVEFIFNDYIINNPKLQNIQKEFSEFIKLEASYEKIYKDKYIYDFNLAEALFIIMIKYSLLSNEVLDTLSIDDSFSGNPEWKYNPENQSWDSINRKAKINFSIDKTELPFKMRMKNYFKAHTKGFIYEFCRQIWIKLIK